MIAAPKPTLVSISVSPSETVVSPAGKVTLKVTGTYSDASSQDVTSVAQFVSSDQKIATVLGNVVTALTTGRVTIIATMNGLFAISNITIGQTTVVSISLSPSPLSVYSGSFFPSGLKASALMSDGSQKDVTSEVTWTSADPTTAPVSANGYVQGLNPGTTKITATLGMVQASVTVQVYGQALKHITVRATPPISSPGDFVTIEVLADFDNGQSVPVTATTTLESSNSGVLKVSSNGTGIALSPGKTVITAKLGGQTVGSVEVVVTNATITRIEISPAKLNIDYPNKGAMTATGVYSDQGRYDITRLADWTVDNSNIANFEQPSGTLIPYNLGTTKVYAYYANLMAVADVTVTAGSPVSLDISEPIVIPNYGTYSVAAYLSYADGNNLDVTNTVVWTSDDPSIFTYVPLTDSFGNFVAGHAGSTKIRAKYGNMTSKDLAITVISDALLAIDLSDSHLQLSVGSTYDFISANGTFQDGMSADITRSVVWKTGNPAIATVSNEPNTVGRITGVSMGTTSLTATLGTISATTTVTVY